MVKIVSHPAAQTAAKKSLNKIADMQDKIGTFHHIKRGENQAFDDFMNKADGLIFSQKTIDKEAELFNKELMKDSKLVFLSQKLNKLPANQEEIKEYEDIANKILDVAEKCGAKNLHETMKATFNLMLENAKNTNKLNLNI